MKFKRTFQKKKEPFPKDAKPRVKNSYYTFSKEYPASKIIKTKHVKRKKERVALAIRIALSVLCFVLITAVSYFAVSLGLNFSNKPTETNNALTSQQAEQNSVTILESDVFRALYMPEDILGNKKELSAFIRSLRRKDCNSVVIDFKNERGRTLFSSQNETAIFGKCAIYDNETVRNALEQFESSGINVVARFFCFEDTTASTTEPSLAVKYKDTDVLWLDELSEGTGKAWLNPYSAKAVDYLLSLLEETVSFGVKGIILESVCYPNTGDISTAGFPGEKNSGQRNTTLLSFVEKAKAAVPSDCFVLTGESCADAVNGNESLYAGTLNKSAANGLCADTAALPEGFVIDKKSHYSSLITLLSQIRQRQDSKGFLVPVIHYGDYTRRYVRTLEDSGFGSYIIFDESGKY